MTDFENDIMDVTFDILRMKKSPKTRNRNEQIKLEIRNISNIQNISKTC